MAGARKLVIEILGNAKDASKAFADVRSDSVKTEERLNKFGSSALMAGTAIAAGLAFAVTEFVQADVASQKLTNSAQNAAASAKINAAALRDVAQATQSKTAADGDALVAGQAMLVQFGATQEQTVALTPLLADLSRKMGVDTETAARAVGRALGGSTAQLQRMGIMVDSAKASTDPFTATMDALRSTVGGFAEAEGATAAGTLERIKNQLGDVVEAVGGGALEAFAPLIDTVSGIVASGGPAGDALGNIAGKLGVISSVTLLAMGGLIKAREGINSIREASIGASGGLGRMGFALGAIGAVGGALALVGIVQSINQATRSTEDFEAALVDLKNAATVRAEIDSLVSAASSMEGLGDRVWDWVMTGSVKTGTLSVDLQGTAVQVDNIGRALEEASARGDLSSIAAWLRVLDENASGSESSMSALGEVTAQYETQVQTAAEALAQKNGISAEEARVTMEAAGAIDEYANALKAQTDPIFGAIRATRQNNDAKQKATDAQNKLTLMELAGQQGTEEYAQAQRELADAQLNSTTSAFGQEAALLNLGSKLKTGEINATQFRAQLDTLVASGAISKQTADNMAFSFGLTAGAANNAAGKVGGVGTAARNVPGNVNTNVSVTGTESTIRRINAVKTAIDAINISLQIVATAERFRRQFEPRATGGPTHAGRPYLVGERGPEIVVPGSGYVVPTRRLVDAPTGPAAGGGGVVVNVTAGVGDPVAIGRGVVDAIKAYERTTGTAWRN